MHQVPRPIDIQDKVARERGEVVHDRDFHDGTRGHGVVSYKQRQRRKEWGRLGRSEDVVEKLPGS
ncbi:hypothetical protein ACWGKW_38845 [Streptomyces sp. NPDC054766]